MRGGVVVKKAEKMIGAVLFLIAVALAVAYFIGAYFVDYALKRGNDTDPLAMPPACERIQDKSRTLPPWPEAPSENWEIVTSDGRKVVATHLVPDNPGEKWAVLVHGYGRDQRYTGDYAEEYLARGYQVLTPDLCASGKSGGKYITMGCKESEEVALWTQEIAERHPGAEIVLHGVSMGSATVLMAAARADAANIVAVVEDCGYSSAYEMFGAQLGVIFGLPSFPIMDFVDVVSGLKTGAKISEAAPIQAVKHIKVPVLFIHGDADKLIPISMMKELYENCPASKEILVMEGAGHGDAMKQDKEVYWGSIFNFLSGINPPD